MKKKIFLVGIIATMGLGTFIVSCSKDEDSGNKTCNCTERNSQGQSHVVQVSPSDYGVSNCSSLTSVLQALEASGFSVSCR